MEPTSKSDRVLDEWTALANTAKPPATAPRPAGNRSSGSFPGLVGAGLLAAALIVALAWLGGRTTGVGADPSPSSSDAAVVESPSAEPSASPEPSPSLVPSEAPSPSVEPSASTAPSATPVPTVGPCTAKDLTARITSWEGAAGNRIASVTLTNASKASCLLTKTATPFLIDGRRTVLAQGMNPPTPATITVKPGETLHTLVDVTNVCTSPIKAPVTVAFDLDANGLNGALVATPTSSSDTTVPPCNGPGQPASIQMQAWTR